MSLKFELFLSIAVHALSCSPSPEVLSLREKHMEKTITIKNWEFCGFFVFYLCASKCHRGITLLSLFPFLS